MIPNSDRSDAAAELLKHCWPMCYTPEINSNDTTVLRAVEFEITPLVSVLPREIVSPGAVDDVAAGQ